ncbi:MAG: phosphoglycerate dehydrogenase [Chloroflexota bacterium]
MIPVLITSLLVDPTGDPADILRAAGCALIQRPYHPGRTEEELVSLMEESRPQGIIAGLDPFSARVIAAGAALGLRVIARTGVGYDTIDVEAATAHGVAVCTSAGSNDQSVADMTFALLLALARHVPYHDRLVREGRVWKRVYGPELWNKTLGIVGFGTIGRAVARRATGFGMRVIACDIMQDAAYAAANNIAYVELDALLRASDVVTLHVSLNPTSRSLIGERELGLMKPSAFLINTSRGAAIDEGALCRALSAGSIAGAGLDVFDREPPTDSPLLAMENVVLTPHAAGVTVESVDRAATMASHNVVNILTGRPPLHIVNPQVLSVE